MDIKKLIEEVLSDLGNNQPMDTIVSKVQIIARLLKNDLFHQWATKEFISGYSSEDELPDYRLSNAVSIKADYVVSMGFGSMMSYSNTDIPIMNLGPEIYKKVMEVKYTDTVGTIQNYLQNIENVSISLSPVDMVYVQQVLGNHTQVLRGHKVIAPSSLKTVVENVRAKLIDMFMDFNDQLFDGTLDFNPVSNKDQISGIVNNYFHSNVINSENGPVAVSESVISAGEKNTISVIDACREMAKVLEKIDGLSKDNPGIQSLVSSARQELEQKQPRKDVLSMVLNAIKSIASTATLSGIEEIVREGIEHLSLFG